MPRALQRALTAKRRHQLEFYQCPALEPFSRGAAHQTAKPSLPQKYKSLFMLAPGISNKSDGISLEYLQTAFALLRSQEKNADVERGKKKLHAKNCILGDFLLEKEGI